MLRIVLSIDSFYHHALAQLTVILAHRHTHLLSLLKAEPFEDISHNRTYSSGTSGRQLKLNDYQLLVLSQPDTIHHVPL